MRLLDVDNLSRCFVITVVLVTRVIVVYVLPLFVVVVVVVTVSPSLAAMLFKSLMLSTLLNVRNEFVVVVVDGVVPVAVDVIVPIDDESSEFVSADNSRSDPFGNVSGARSARFSRKKAFFNLGLFVTDVGNDRASVGSVDRSAQLFCFCFLEGSNFFGFCWRRSEKNHSEFGFRCSVGGAADGGGSVILTTVSLFRSRST